MMVDEDGVVEGKGQKYAVPNLTLSSHELSPVERGEAGYCM